MKLGELFTELKLRDKGYKVGMANAKMQATKTNGALRALGATLIRVFSGYAVLRGLTSITKAFGVQEKAERDLASALMSHGAAVDQLMPRYRRFAAEIQKVTVFGDEMVLSLMAQIRNLGVDEGRLEGATKGALGLSKALGLDLNSAARYAALALEGEFTILQRYVPALRTATDATEKMAIVQGLMARGFAQVEAEAQTVQGSFKQLANQWGDLKERMGEKFAPGLLEAMDFWLDLRKPGSNRGTEVTGMSARQVSLMHQAVISLEKQIKIERERDVDLKEHLRVLTAIREIYLDTAQSVQERARIENVVGAEIRRVTDAIKEQAQERERAEKKAQEAAQKRAEDEAKERKSRIESWQRQLRGAEESRVMAHGTHQDRMRFLREEEAAALKTARSQEERNLIEAVFVERMHEERRRAKADVESQLRSISGEGGADMRRRAAAPGTRGIRAMAQEIQVAISRSQQERRMERIGEAQLRELRKQTQLQEEAATAPAAMGPLS